MNPFFSQESELFTHLFNKMIDVAKKAESPESERWQRLILLNITEKVMQSHREGTLIREMVGDYVHIGVLQALNASILASNPYSKTFLYEGGVLIGKFGPIQGLTSFLAQEQKMSGMPHSSEVKKHFLNALKFIYSPQSRLQVADSLKYRTKKNGVVIQLINSAYAAGNTVFNEPLCYAIAGEIAGLATVTLGENSIVIEQKCVGKGDDYCEFHLSFTDDTSQLDEYLGVKKHSGEYFFNIDERIQFEMATAATAHNTYLSTLLKKRIRKTSDYTHISVLQNLISGLHFSDPFNRSLLYFAGVNYGRILENSGVLLEIMQHRGFEPKLPLEFEDAVRLIDHYLNSPLQLLTRMHSDVVVEVIDDESAKLKVFECALATGLNLRESLHIIQDSSTKTKASLETEPITFCDFFSGYLAGRLSLVTSEEISVKETKCHVNGDNYCEFYIEIP